MIIIIIIMIIIMIIIAISWGACPRSSLLLYL